MDNDIKIRVLFTRNTDPEREGAAFSAGEEAELNFASAHRWFRRNAAVEIPAAPKETRAEAEKPAEAPKASESSTLQLRKK